VKLAFECFFENSLIKLPVYQLYFLKENEYAERISISWAALLYIEHRETFFAFLSDKYCYKRINTVMCKYIGSSI